MARDIPRDRWPDGTLPLLSEGYDFIPRRVRGLQSDVFETRLLLQRTLCMSGAAAARLLYDEERFERAEAAPGRVRRTLFGVGGVQGMDGDAHRHRKGMLLSVLAPPEAERLAALSEEHWREYAARWERRERIVLLEEARELLCEAVCDWAEVPLDRSEVSSRARDLGSTIAAGGALGPAHWAGRVARGRLERWAEDLVRRVRDGDLPASPERALGAVALHRDVDGSLLDGRTAAVELLNVLRPTVAVAYYVVFLALALQSYAGERARLLAGEVEPEWFVHEVRRFYPFFPFVAARTRHEFEWEGYRFPAGVRVLLDLYGTNHDPRLWAEPSRFRPERFRDWDGDPFTLVPQGGGDHAAGHRCPGEWATIELMKTGLRFLTTAIRYDVPPQDLRTGRSRMPTAPRSGFVMSAVRPA